MPTLAPAEHTARVQQLFVKHQSTLKAIVLSLQPDFAEADDILQEVFLTVTRKAGEFRADSNFVAWARAIARFKVMEFRRRRQKAPYELSEEVIEALCAAVPEEGFFEERLAAVRGCLDRLAPRTQELIKLRYYAEHGPEEIAQLMSWTANSVNVTLSKARSALRDCVEHRVKEAS